MRALFEYLDLAAIKFSRAQFFWCLAIVCQILFWYFAVPGPQIAKNYAASLPSGIWACVWSSVFLLAIPLVYWKLAGRPFRELGLGLGDWKFGCLAVVVLSLVLMPLVAVGAWDQQIQDFFPLVGKDLGDTNQWIIWFLWYGLFYIAFEVFYRGFLLHGPSDIAENTRVSMSIVCCTLIHVGKPLLETMASLPASFLFVWLALRTRSIWYGILLHWMIGIVNDLSVLWQTE